MKLIAITITLLLIAPLTVHAQVQPPSRFWEDFSHGALYFTVGADMGTTEYGIRKDHRGEANPLLGQRTAERITILAASTVAADYATHFLARKGHPWLGFLGRAFISGAHGYAAGRNLR